MDSHLKNVLLQSFSLSFLCLYLFFIDLICKVVLLSGHLDSWDVGQGAMDDGGGAMISWEVLSLMKDLGTVETNIPYVYKHIQDMETYIRTSTERNTFCTCSRSVTKYTDNSKLTQEYKQVNDLLYCLALRKQFASLSSAVC